MGGFMRTVRLLIGVGMVAAGSSLAAPGVIELVRFGQAVSQPAAAETAPAVLPAPQSPVASPALVAAGGAAASPPSPAWEPASEAAVALDRDYVLPTPPPPLPPVPAGPAQAPGLANAYRSTLDVPPPPLLDGQAAPPLAPGWARHGQGEPRSGLTARPVAQQPRVYVVRDGDDLTGIATRFYGHPAAAASIWQANRGLLPDPGVLPIGAAILLPDPASVAGMVQAGPHSPSIEPAPGPGAIRAVGQTLP